MRQLMPIERLCALGLALQSVSSLAWCLGIRSVCGVTQLSTALVIRACAPTGSDLEGVLGLLRRAKATVGFLPDSAVRERASKGTLLIAELAGSLAGYALYDLPRQEIQI